MWHPPLLTILHAGTPLVTPTDTPAVTPAVTPTVTPAVTPTVKLAVTPAVAPSFLFPGKSLLNTFVAKMIFIWSRLRVLNDASDKSVMRLRHMNFKDFMEALTRLSTVVALPIDADLEESGGTVTAVTVVTVVVVTAVTAVTLARPSRIGTYLTRSPRDARSGQRG